MPRLDEISLKIRGDGSCFIEEQKAGCIKRRPINPDDYWNIIKQSLVSKNKGAKISRSFLPNNVIYMGQKELFGDAMEKTIHFVFIERPKCIRSYKYHGQTYTVGYPRLVFGFQVENKITSSLVVAVKENEVINNETNVYHFPYHNVFRDGSICWGSGRPGNIKSLRDLEYAPEAFYVIEHEHETNGAEQNALEMVLQNENKIFDDDQLVKISNFEKIAKEFIGE